MTDLRETNPQNVGRQNYATCSGSSWSKESEREQGRTGKGARTRQGEGAKGRGGRVGGRKKGRDRRKEGVVRRKGKGTGKTWRRRKDIAESYFLD